MTLDVRWVRREVVAVGLARATDRDVWQYVRDHNFVLVSPDSDFNDLAFIHGPLPKIIWLRVANASTDDIEQLLTTVTDDVSPSSVTASRTLCSSFARRRESPITTRDNTAALWE